LFAEGLSGADWPVEYGGQADYHPTHGRIVSEEILRARAPRPVDQVNLAAHVILHFGSPEQKQNLLPPIRSSEHVWCQLLSEPGAGSDIAAVRARGQRRDDDRWQLDGQKTWITDAHWAEMGLALIRTDPESSRHRGLTMFVVPMHAAGVEVRPIRTIGGSYDINEVFFDQVVLSPESVIGGVGNGWNVIMTGLDFERFGIGSNVALLELLVTDLLHVVKHLEHDGGTPSAADVWQEVAALAVEADVSAAFIDEHVERLLDGSSRPGDAAVAKISFAETYHAIASYGARLGATTASKANAPVSVAEARERLRDWWLWSRAYTISGGSTEIMRNILAKRELELPDATVPAKNAAPRS
jgi:alkylation response protein AidB-like acyl-CoA dehydrogenase